MASELDHLLALLERTPAALRALLRGLPALPPTGLRDDWDPHAVLGHLIHGEETDWLPRAEIILAHGEARPFVPFDRLAQFENWGDRPLDELLDIFAERRARNLDRLRALRLTPAQLALRGTHPELGTVSLHQLIAAWAVHDLNHLGQIAEGLAKPYAEAVGPWRAYLDILNR
jgi:hypothetical protein